MEAHFVEPVKDENGEVVDYLGWPIGTRWRYPQHKTTEERIKNAKIFQEQFGFPEGLEFVVDSFPNNSFNRSYAAWPDSAYYVHNSLLAYRGLLEAEGMRMAPFSQDIEKMLPK